jgi:hypothetical protein
MRSGPTASFPTAFIRLKNVELFERFGLDPSGFEGETFRDRPPKDT